MEEIDKFIFKIGTIIKMIGTLDDKNIERVCNNLDISIDDLYYLFKICFSNNKSSIDNKTDAKRLTKELLDNMTSLTNEVATAMANCSKEGKLYNLYNHYKKYGMSPYVLTRIAKTLNQEEATKIVNSYIETHFDIFTTVSPNKINEMLRKTSLYEFSFYLENEKVNCDRRILTRVINTLDEESIPIYKGTLFEMLKLEKERTISIKSNKILKKYYKISKRV